VKDRLERVGNDATCDGHVDRWDRDAELMAQEEAQNGVQISDAGGAQATPGISDGTKPVTMDVEIVCGGGTPKLQTHMGGGNAFPFKGI